MSEPFWIADPSVLFRQDTWLAFVPTPGMTVDQSLNAVVRFVTYLSALLFLCSMDFRYILYIPVTMLVTVALQGLDTLRELTQGPCEGNQFMLARSRLCDALAWMWHACNLAYKHKGVGGGGV